MEDPYDLLEKYLNNELSPEERSAFEARLAKDEELAMQLQIEKSIMEGIEHFGNQNLKTQLQEIHHDNEELLEKQKPGLKIKKYFWIIAASIAILITLLLWQLTPKESTAERLYAAYITTEFNFTEKSGTQDLLQSAEVALNDKDYQVALQLLNQYTEQEEIIATDVLLARGIALVETGAYSEALATFDLVYNRGGIYEDIAQWHKSLTSLKKGSTSESLNYLNQMSNDAGFRVDDLKKEIKKLER